MFVRRYQCKIRGASIIEKVDVESYEDLLFSMPTPQKGAFFRFQVFGAKRICIFKDHQLKSSPFRSVYVILIAAKIYVLLSFGPLAIVTHYDLGFDITLTVAYSMYELV